MQSSGKKSTSITGKAQINEFVGIFYRRIWSSVSLGKWEIVLWTIAAVYLGFRVFDYTFWIDNLYFWYIPYYGILISSPLVIGWMIRKTHAARGEVGNLISVTTTKPSIMVLSNWLAVALSCIRFFLPTAILFVISHFMLFRYWDEFPECSWSVAAISQLVNQPYTGPRIWLLAGHGWHAWDVILFLGFCQVLGWFTLPISWGLWVESRLSRISRWYGVIFISYLIFPLANFGMAQLVKSLIVQRLGLFGSAPGNLILVIYIGMSSLIISGIILWVTVINMGRRDR